MSAEIDVPDMQADEFGAADAGCVEGHNDGSGQTLFIQPPGLFPVGGDIQGFCGGIVFSLGKIPVDGFLAVEFRKPFFDLGSCHGFCRIGFYIAVLEQVPAESAQGGYVQIHCPGTHPTGLEQKDFITPDNGWSEAFQETVPVSGGDAFPFLIFRIQERQEDFQGFPVDVTCSGRVSPDRGDVFYVAIYVFHTFIRMPFRRFHMTVVFQALHPDDSPEPDAIP